MLRRKRKPQHRTFVYADSKFGARIWCEKNGVQPYARTTYLITSPMAVRGVRLRPTDRVVFVGWLPDRRDFGDTMTNFRCAGLRSVEWHGLENWHPDWPAVAE